MAGRTFFKGDEIAKQGAVPTDVVFLTSGAAMVTSQFKEEARLRKLDVMQLCPGRTVETVGLQIVAPNVEPHRWSLVSAEPSTEHRSPITTSLARHRCASSTERRWLRCQVATTICSGFRVAANVAKSVLSYRHVLDKLKEHEDAVAAIIEDRLTQLKEGEELRAGMVRGNENHVHSCLHR